MRGHEEDATIAAALEAYRAAAHAEADAHFDERALEAQRARILQRIDQAGHRARVIPFPGAPEPLRGGASSSRRWISAAAAAGLLIGLLTGQLVHVLPGGDAWMHRAVSAPAVAPARMAAVPAVATLAADPDDELLDAVELAVSWRGASDLRAFDDLTFAYEPR
jgi:hypothetical protein